MGRWAEATCGAARGLGGAHWSFPIVMWPVHLFGQSPPPSSTNFLPVPCVSTHPVRLRPRGPFQWVSF